MLSSLVINPPYKVDGHTTSPKVAKTLTLPFGIRLSSATLFILTKKFFFSSSLFMAMSCVFLTCLYLPLEKHNLRVINSAKSLTNEKYYLLQNLQESSSYNKLFSNLGIYSLKDAQEIIQIKSSLSKTTTQKKNRFVSINKYPSIQFSGF